jgi:hypothetical protein
VDVVVDQPIYALNGETLRLNGQLSWAAYVRVNGIRWEWPVFSPSYVPGGTWPDVAVDSGGKVYYGYLGGRFGKEHAFVRTSDDFADAVRLSPPDTDENPHGIALGIDPSGVAHVFWTEQRLGQSSMPFHASSSDWTPVPLGDTVFGLLDVRPSIVFTGGRIEMFDELLFRPVAASGTLLFRGAWRTAVTRADLTDFPAKVAVRTLDRRLVDTFTIEAWSEQAVTIDRLVFTPQVRKLFDGAELPSLDLQSVPAGALTLRVSVSDGASWRAFDAPFVRVPGQNKLTLVDFTSAADELGAVLATIPPSHLTAPGLASVLRFWLDAVLVTVERALVTLDLPMRTFLVDRAHDTLRDRVVQRGDGCSVTGAPDGDDWVLDCADQSRLSAAGGRPSSASLCKAAPASRWS